MTLRILLKILGHKDNGGFIIVNSSITKKYGLVFSNILSKLLALFQTTGQKEIYYTSKQCKNDLGISYFMYKKALKVGEDLNIWSTVSKYNKQARGTINNLIHIKINLSKLTKIFKDLGLVTNIKKPTNDGNVRYKNVQHFKSDMLKKYDDGQDFINTQLIDGVANGTVYIKNGVLKSDFMNYESLPNSIAIKVWEFAYKNQNLLL
jgi:hypothetical protein